MKTVTVGGVPGLQLSVSNRTKSWRLLYRLKGDPQQRRRSLGLGRYPSVSLSEARQRAKDAVALASNGTDPKHHRSRRIAEQEVLLQQVARDYLRACETDNCRNTQRDKESALRVHVLPLHGSRPIRSLTKQDCLSILDGLAVHPARRRLVYAYMRHMLDWAVEREHLSANPMLSIRPPRPVSPRDRALSDAEIRRLWADNSLMGAMAKIQLLTAQRSGSVQCMRWDEIDFDTGVWTVPAVSMKSGKPHQVPLSGAVLEILRHQPRLLGPYVFGLGSLGNKPFNGSSKGMKRLRERGAASDWRLHDLRRTAVTIAQRGGAPLEHIAALTQHRPAGVLGVYARYDYLAEKRSVASLIERQVNLALEQRAVD